MFANLVFITPGRIIIITTINLPERSLFLLTYSSLPSSFTYPDSNSTFFFPSTSSSWVSVSSTHFSEKVSKTTSSGIGTEFSAGSRSWDKGGGARSSRPLDKGGTGLQKNFFQPFGPQYGLKIREGGPPPPPAPPLDPPLESTFFVTTALARVVTIAIELVYGK